MGLVRCSLSRSFYRACRGRAAAVHLGGCRILPACARWHALPLSPPSIYLSLSRA